MTSWDNLSPAQRAAVLHDDGPAAVYAGPGSGKTRVVTLRAARLAAKGRRLLVTTFTSDATEEMRARIEGMLASEHAQTVHVTTMHALCLQILRTEGRKFQLLTDEFQRRSLAEAARAAELEGGTAAFLTQQSYQKNLGVTAASYRHDGSTEDIEFARVWRSYEKAKEEKGLKDFDDFILDVLLLFQTDDEARQRVAMRYSHIVVDECQDMNRPQYAVAFALGREHKNLMLVGDLDQSLYGFRGADTQTFQQFAANPKAKVYELRENYRCTRSILSFADSLIRQDTERRVLSFVATRPEGAPVTWSRYPDPDIEALATAEQIIRLKEQGAGYREMAVLFRTNAQSEAFERHFAALEIPFTIREDGDFYGRKEVQGLLCYLNLFAGAQEAAQGHNPPPAKRKVAYELYPDEWLLALLNVPARKLSRSVGSQLKNFAEIRGRRIWDILPEFHAPDLKTHRALRALNDELRRIDSRLKQIAHAGDAIRIVRQATDFDGWLRRDGTDEKDNDRIQNLQRMQAAGAHYETIAAYLDAVQKVRDEASRRKAERAKRRREIDQVTLSTGHAAKGLEWSIVFAVGWSEGILPHRKAEHIDEERRIAYVIATRAKDLLRVSTLDSWNDAAAAPSRFLTGLQVTVTQESAQETEPLDRAEPVDDFGGLFMPS